MLRRYAKRPRLKAQRILEMAESGAVSRRNSADQYAPKDSCTVWKRKWQGC